MGKAAGERRMRRMKYLAKLAEENPDRFDKEWEKRLSSWLQQIRKDAGFLRDKQGKSVPRVFGYVEEAMSVLGFCGHGVLQKYAESSFEILTNECCRAFAGRVDPRLFRLNNYPKVPQPLQEVQAPHVETEREFSSRRTACPATR